MRHIRNINRIPLCLVFSSLFPLSAIGQFSGNIQGVVKDATGAGVPNAHVELLNTDTNVSKKTDTDASGIYRFVSLAPGPYKIIGSGEGFSPTTIVIQLTTGQTLEVPLQVSVQGIQSSVDVSAQSPLLDTADSRNQLTIAKEALNTLPLQGRSLLPLTTLAPGVTGKGVLSTTPGSATDNFNTETQVDASANGRSSGGNVYIIDGLDITSGIRPGVLNLSPNPDAVAEASVQVNTFTVDYGHASSIQMMMTTKSGTEKFHGNASDYFTNQKLWAGTEFTKSYKPFHSNNISASLGGPIIPHHQFFFFGSVEPLRSSTSGATAVTYEDPAFIAFAKANFPNSIGTQLISTYGVHNTIKTGTILASSAISGCGTPAGGNVPCNLPVLNTGNFTSSGARNGLQWNVRVDKYWSKDRLYGNFFNSNLDTKTDNARGAFAATSAYNTPSLQINETHTFSERTLNEAQFGFTYVHGRSLTTGLFAVPNITVTGENGFGSGAPYQFIQHNFHWRDVVTHVLGHHQFKAGYEGSFNDNLYYGQYNKSIPTFTFTSVLNLAQDNPFSETNLAYDPSTGQAAPAGSSFFYYQRTWGAFFQDNWKVNSRLTINYGLRYDDFGNSLPTKGQIANNFIPGSGNSLAERVASGNDLKRNKVLDGSINNVWSPRVGLAYDITGRGTWVLHGGAGIYHDWPTLGQISEAVANYSNPYQFIVPTFYNNGTTSGRPQFELGKSSTAPFGYTYPSLPAGTIGPNGGLIGSQLSVGAIDPALSAPNTYNEAISLEHEIRNGLKASVGYIGSQSTGLITGAAYANTNNAVPTGLDINRFAGDLLTDNVLNRLNPSFGAIPFMGNEARANYNGVFVALQGRFTSRGFFTASYTRSRAWDNDSMYPTRDFDRYYGPSNTDAPNRFSLGVNYNVPGLNHGNGLVGRVTDGWRLNGITVLQSGYPFTVYTSQAFVPSVDQKGAYIRDNNGLIVPAVNSGDYNADGYNMDYPNVPGYTQPTSRSAYLTGLWPKSYFSAPAPGTLGNELQNQFRNPGYANTDFGVAKSTKITESVNFDLRFDFFNVFNRANLQSVTSDLSSSNFGKSVSQYNPRWIQIGGNLTF